MKYRDIGGERESVSSLLWLWRAYFLCVEKVVCVCAFDFCIGLDNLKMARERGRYLAAQNERPKVASFLFYLFVLR